MEGSLDEIIKIAIISINDKGPYVVTHDLDPLYLSLSTEGQVTQYLDELSTTTIISLGQGHSYSEGSFEFPCTTNPDLRIIVTATRLLDLTAEDHRLIEGYYHIGLFIPKSYAVTLPNTVVYQKMLQKVLKTSIRYSSDFTHEKLISLKYKLYDLLFN